MTIQRDRQPPDERLARQARTLFDDSVDGFDAATRSQLNRRRHEALESAAGGFAWGWQRMVPATGVAAAAVLAVLVVNGRGPEVATLPTNGVADMEILLEGDELEMFEDLEFYTLLEFEANGEAHVG